MSRPALVIGGGAVVILVAVLLWRFAGGGGIDDDLELALKRTAAAQEDFQSSHPTYTVRVDLLVEDGLKIPQGVVVTVPFAGITGYCAEASAEGTTWYFDTDEKDTPKPGRCTLT